MEAHETHEQIHEVAHHGNAGHGHGGNKTNKRVAILISVLACLLSIVEICGSTSANRAMASNIEAANLWSFFQAKTIRATTMKTAADALETVTVGETDKDKLAALDKRITQWRTTAERYESEPETGEGRKELAARAKVAEQQRAELTNATHLFEMAAAALQIAIVLCSAAVVTSRLILAGVACGLGGLGVAVALLAWIAPNILHH